MASHNGNGQRNVSLDGELVDYRLPWQPLDGLQYDETALRSAHVEAVALINDFAAQLESVLARKEATINDVRVRFYGLSGALGLNIMDGRSFTQIADELGCSRASLSKLATEFCAAHALPSSFMMKSSGTMTSYQSARLDSIRRANGQRRAPAPRGEVFPVPPRHRSV